MRRRRPCTQRTACGSVFRRSGTGAYNERRSRRGVNGSTCRFWRVLPLLGHVYDSCFWVCAILFVPTDFDSCCIGSTVAMRILDSPMYGVVAVEDGAKGEWGRRSYFPVAPELRTQHAPSSTPEKPCQSRTAQIVNIYNFLSRPAHYCV